MFYWLFIICGIILLTLSLSNPFFNLLIKKNINISTIKEILLRFFLFLLSIIVIFTGLYVESSINIS